MSNYCIYQLIILNQDTVGSHWISCLWDPIAFALKIMAHTCTLLQDSHMGHNNQTVGMWELGSQLLHFIIELLLSLKAKVSKLGGNTHKMR